MSRSDFSKTGTLASVPRLDGILKKLGSRHASRRITCNHRFATNTRQRLYLEPACLMERRG